jgi:polar amino acid transport system substrate-binding protein
MEKSLRSSAKQKEIARKNFIISNSINVDFVKLKKSYKIRYLILILIAVSFTAVIASDSKSREQNIIRLVAGQKYYPYYAEDLPQKGFISQIILESFKAANYVLKTEYIPWARALKMVKQGNRDGIFAIWYRKEREEWGAFSDPFYSNERVLLKLKKTKFQYSTLGDLKNLNVGVVRGYSNPELFTKNTTLVIDESADNIQNLLKLNKKRVDLIIIDQMVAEYLLHNNNDLGRDKYEWFGEPIEIISQHIAFSKKTKNYQIKLKAFNKGLKIIKANGIYENILKKSGLFKRTNIEVDID